MHQEHRSRERAHAQAHERAEQQRRDGNGNQLRNEVGRVLSVPAQSHEAQLRERESCTRDRKDQSGYALRYALAAPQHAAASLRLPFLANWLGRILHASPSIASQSIVRPRVPSGSPRASCTLSLLSRPLVRIHYLICAPFGIGNVDVFVGPTRVRGYLELVFVSVA